MGVMSYIRTVIIIALCLSTLTPAFTKAATKTDLQKKQQQIEAERKQKEAERKKKEADAAALNSLIVGINNNIAKTSSALKSTTSQLEQTQQDLDNTTQQLTEAEQRLVELKDEVEKLLVEFYEQQESDSPVLAVFSSQNLSDSIALKQYHDALQQEFDKLVQQEEQTRNDVATTKTNLEQQQATLQGLQAGQVAAKKGLEYEQARKTKVLADTNSAIDTLKKEEADLANREKEVEGQIQALLNARKAGKVVGGLNKPVKQGDVIGYQGNTGNSTGSHLHFTVMLNCDFGQTVNPLDYLGSTLAWPLSDYRITQAYGYTSFAKAGAYHGAIHNGVDLQQYAGAPIHAAASGTIIVDQYFGGYGNAIIIDHGNSLCSLYGHMS